MLSDIQAMIVDYKKKSTYSNLVGNAEEEVETLPSAREEPIMEPVKRLAQTSGAKSMFEV